MKSELNRDMKHLDQLAFHRVEKCGDLVRRFHALPKRAKLHPAYALLKSVHPWLLIPLSLWPIDCVGLGCHLLEYINAKKSPNAKLGSFVIIFEKDAVVERANCNRAHMSTQVRTGNYEGFIAAPSKFKYKDEIWKEDPDLKADWNAINVEFDVSKYRDPKGIIRRRLVQRSEISDLMAGNPMAYKQRPI